MVLSNLQGQKTVTLDAGKQLVVTADALSSGHISRLAVKPGDTAQGFTTIGVSTSTTFGPFTQSQRFAITSNLGEITSVIQEVDYLAPEEAATAAQGALADSAQQPQSVVALTDATLALTNVLHAGNIVAVDKADGSTITLPVATGSGDKYSIYVETTITSVGLVIQVTTTDIMKGGVMVKQDGGDTVVGFETASDTDTITLDGSTKGGITGEKWIIEDVEAGVWAVNGVTSATDTEVTPFSAAVS